MTEPRPPSEWLKLMLDEISRRKKEEADAAAESARRERRAKNSGEHQPPGSRKIP